MCAVVCDRQRIPHDWSHPILVKNAALSVRISESTKVAIDKEAAREHRVRNIWARVMRTFLAILFCTIAQRALAQMNFDSGNFMLPACKALIEGPSAGPRLNVWAGQCAGVIDGLKWIGSPNGCLSATTSPCVRSA